MVHGFLREAGAATVCRVWALAYGEMWRGWPAYACVVQNRVRDRVRRGSHANVWRRGCTLCFETPATHALLSWLIRRRNVPEKFHGPSGLCVANVRPGVRARAQIPPLVQQPPAAEMVDNGAEAQAHRAVVVDLTAEAVEKSDAAIRASVAAAKPKKKRAPADPNAPKVAKKAKPAAAAPAAAAKKLKAGAKAAGAQPVAKTAFAKKAAPAAGKAKAAPAKVKKPKDPNAPKRAKPAKAGALTSEQQAKCMAILELANAWRLGQTGSSNAASVPAVEDTKTTVASKDEAAPPKVRVCTEHLPDLEGRVTGM